MINAFVLITVPAKRSGGVVEELRKYQQIREAFAVYGEADVVARVEVASLQELDTIVMDVIQGYAEVKTTRTYVAIEKLRWEK